jgi:hypothetical protein
MSEDDGPLGSSPLASTQVAAVVTQSVTPLVLRAEHLMTA